MDDCLHRLHLKERQPKLRRIVGLLSTFSEKVAMKAFAPFLCYLVVVLSATARADIYRWDNGQLIPGTEGITPGPGVVLDHHELAFAALSERDLTGARFDFSNLTNAYLQQLDADQCQPGRGQSHQRTSVLLDADQCQPDGGGGDGGLVRGHHVAGVHPGAARVHR